MAQPTLPAAAVFPPNHKYSTRLLTVSPLWSTTAFRRRLLRTSFRSTLCSQDFLFEVSTSLSNSKMHHRGKWGTCAMRNDMIKLVSCSDFMDEEKGSCKRLELKSHLLGHLTTVIHSLSISSFIFLRWSRINMANSLLKTLNHLHGFSMQAFGSTNLPFASLSSPLNKPTPLNLDLAFPSIGDLRWSIARMAYLFNMQVERNVATFLLVLIVACFSFVVIGGFLFYKLRNNSQSLEDCFWEAWSCLCSSSTHLRV